MGSANPSRHPEAADRIGHGHPRASVHRLSTRASPDELVPPVPDTRSTRRVALAQFRQRSAQPFASRPARPLAHAFAIRLDHAARPALAHLVVARQPHAWRQASNFSARSPLAPRCRASRPPKAASASRSRPQTASAAWPPTRPCRRTWLPSVESCAADLMLAAHIGSRCAGLRLPQRGDDLLFRRPRSLHRPVLPSDRTLAPTGANHMGHSTPPLSLVSLRLRSMYDRYPPRHEVAALRPAVGFRPL